MRFWRGLALLLLALLFIYPLARLLLLPLAAGSASVESFRPFLNSAAFALLTGCIVAPLGALAAQALETKAGGAVRALGLGLWLLFFTPGYVLTTGWLVIFTHPLLRDNLQNPEQGRTGDQPPAQHRSTRKIGWRGVQPFVDGVSKYRYFRRNAQSGGNAELLHRLNGRDGECGCHGGQHQAQGKAQAPPRGQAQHKCCFEQRGTGPGKCAAGNKYGER